MQVTTIPPERVEEWLGATLYSSDREAVGSVEEVFLDKDTGKPEWLALGAGLLGRKRTLVPIAAAEPRSNGVHVPYSAEQIAAAPQVEGGEVSQDEERTLYSHYGLRYSERRSDTGLAAGQGEPAPRRTSGRPSPPATGDGEPTRDELYAEAKRLDIEGRSKMNKQQLARAVGRRRERDGTSRAKANPIEVQKFLEGVGYPVRKADLVREAEKQGASAEVRSTLKRIRDEKFDSPADVSEAIGRLN
jgi:Protein of unknown function (DUF2795)/PRC-barrel domain